MSAASATLAQLIASFVIGAARADSHAWAEQPPQFLASAFSFRPAYHGGRRPAQGASRPGLVRRPELVIDGERAARSTNRWRAALAWLTWRARKWT